MERKTVRVILVRHGETAWNRDRIFRGREDIPLNERGLAQAQTLAAAVARIPVHAVYSSPLSRAAETARPVADRHGLAVIPEPDLVDLDYGAWQGRRAEDVEREWPAEMRIWRSAPHDCRIPGGETLGQVRDRADRLLRRLGAAHSGRTVVLVSHRIVAKIILCHVLGLPEDRCGGILQSNACLNVFDMGDSRAVVRLMNDTCHLGEAVPLEDDF